LIINIEYNFARYRKRGPELCLLMVIDRIGVERYS